jgi:hypothetical protein
MNVHNFSVYSPATRLSERLSNLKIPYGAILPARINSEPVLLVTVYDNATLPVHAPRRMENYRVGYAYYWGIAL